MKKYITITIIIGSAVFVIGNLFSGGFNFKNVNEFLIDFSFYQLYSFVLGFSNMYFFGYMERRNWKKNDTLKRLIIGILGAIIITLIGLFLLRASIAIVYRGISFNQFLSTEQFRYYQFGLWVTLTIVVILHVIYFYNK